MSSSATALASLPVSTTSSHTSPVPSGAAAAAASISSFHAEHDEEETTALGDGEQKQRTKSSKPLWQPSEAVIEALNVFKAKVDAYNALQVIHSYISISSCSF
jgi:hypothetical protein